MNINILKENNNYLVECIIGKDKGKFLKLSAQEVVKELIERIPKNYDSDITIYSKPYDAPRNLEKVNGLILEDIARMITYKHKEAKITTPSHNYSQ
jgi:hypothetical protein